MDQKLHPVPAPVTAILLAGSRPGNDPLLAGSDATTKALLPVASRPMAAYPLDALREANCIGRVIVCAREDSAWLPLLGGMDDVELRPAEASIARTLETALRSCEGPLLVTTADHVLLTPEMVAHFLRKAAGADVAAAMVERRVLRRAGYDSRRTWLTFRGGSWSGANLFWLNGAKCLPLIRFWADIEQDRKKGRRIIAAFGPSLAIAAALRLADVHTLIAKAGRRFGLDARVVSMPQAEACIDVDNAADLLLVSDILARRTTGAPVASDRRHRTIVTKE